jgi:hypothetical protein
MRSERETIIYITDGWLEEFGENNLSDGTDFQKLEWDFQNDIDLQDIHFKNSSVQLRCGAELKM